MDGPHLIYFADPMCSWCYGFSPVVADIRRTFGRALPIRLVMGGLRPGTEEPMTQEAKDSLAGHWHHVHEATGLPFDRSAIDREGFLYDTDPGARAVVRMRREDPEKALTYLGRLQAAFYGEGKDVTDFEVLADLAAEYGVDRDAFRADLDTDELKRETWGDYGLSQRAGVTGFPTLVAGPGPDGAYGVVTRGFAPGDQVIGVLQRWLEPPPANVH
jgi:putative protein-disulfide isomerase